MTTTTLAPDPDAGRDTSPPWPDLVDVPPPDRRVLLAVAASAVATDVALRSGLDGLGGTMLVAVTVAGLLASGRVTNRRAWSVLLLGASIGLGLSLRDAGWLLALDVLAAGGLLALGASVARHGDPFDQTLPDLVGRAVHGIVHGVLAPAFVLHGLRRETAAGGSSAVAVLRGLLLGTPVVIVVALLLGSADPVFASFFRLPGDVGDLVVHAVLLTVGAWTAAALLRVASAPAYAVRMQPWRPLGTVEATTVLVGLVAVFAAFTASQVVTVLGGDAYVRRTAGLGYADYARRGFFQLLAVAAITLAVLLVVRASVRDDTDRRVVWLGEAAVVLVLVLVAGAVRRLGLYEQAYGLTLLRLFALLFAVWLGGVYGLLGLSLAGVGRGRAWFVPAGIGLAVAGLLVLNVANPEAIIVRRNVDRLAATDRLDAVTLTELSDDAVPSLVAALPSLSPDDAAVVVSRLCSGDRARDPRVGPWAFNLSRRAAADARAEVCP